MRPWRWSIFMAAWLALVGSLAAVLWLTAFMLLAHARQQLREELEVQMLLLHEQIAPSVAAEDVVGMQQQVRRFTDLTGNQAAVVLNSGEGVASSTAPTPANAASNPPTNLVAAARDDTSAIALSLPLTRHDTTIGELRAGLPESAVESHLAPIRRSVWLAGWLLAGLTTAIVFSAQHRVRKPLELMRRSAQRLAREELTGQRALPSAVELSGLAGALDAMADELEERFGLFSRRGSEQEAVLASMVEGVLAVDSQEHVISMNAAAAKLLDARPEEAKGRGLQEVIRNADLRRFVARALASDRPIEDDLILRTDAERVLQAHGTSLRDGRGRPSGAVIVLNDVTHVRRLENIRREFVANVSHELKTPITSIKGFVETLLDGALRNPADAERFLRIVARQADRLNAIIEDLLSLAKIEQADTAAHVELAPGRLREVLQAAIDECRPRASEREIAMPLECDEQLLATINATLLEQAVINLLDNALKCSEPQREVLVQAVQQTDEVQIRVRDQGCGIEAEHLDRLFERFYRVDKARSRKLGGTGLGLAIVKHIVHIHGGCVSVESSPGVGSTFTIHLPA